jgi:methionine-rich copper-binding protein CopC
VSTSVTRVAGLLAAIVIPLLVPAAALAHAELETSTPAAGSTVPAPVTEVELRFTEGLDAGRSRFVLEGPAGELGTGRANRDGGRVMRLSGLSLEPGAYTVKVTIASADGHEIERETFPFTVEEAPPSAPPSAAPSDVPASEAPSAEPSPGAPSPAPGGAGPSPVEPSPTAATDPAPAADSGGDVLLPIVAALVIVAVVGAWVLRRGRAA